MSNPMINFNTNYNFAHMRAGPGSLHKAHTAFMMPPMANLFGSPFASHGGHNFGMQQGMMQLFQGLGQLFQGLAQMLGQSQGQSFPQAFPASTGGSTFKLAQAPIAGEARIWGDPHFIGADGGKFDVQGEAGKTYNLLSDNNFQMNGRFDSWGSKGATVVGHVGITTRDNHITVDKDGSAVVNGQELKKDGRIALENGGYVERRGKNITVSHGEWTVDFQTRGDHINMDIKTDNAVADGVRPHGLIGQTFDGDGLARNGDKGSGAQGGGAIEYADGSTSTRGDKLAVESYEVRSIYDTAFIDHNADYTQGQVSRWWA